MATLAEMYVQGVPTRKVKAISVELSGLAFSAPAVSPSTSACMKASDFLPGPRDRGLKGVEFVVADDQPPKKPTTTACESCAGCMTGETSRPAATFPHGSQNGPTATRSSAPLTPQASQEHQHA